MTFLWNNMTRKEVMNLKDVEMYRVITSFWNYLSMNGLGEMCQLFLALNATERGHENVQIG